MTTTLEQLDRVFGALADSTRRAILARLVDGEATVNELVTLSQLSQPTVSKHVKVLERANLVSRGREAQFRPVRLNAAPLASAVMWLGNYRGFLEQSLDQLEDLVNELQRQEERTSE